MNHPEIKSKIPILNWQARKKAPPNEVDYTLKKVSSVATCKPAQRNLNNKAISTNAKLISGSGQIKEQAKPKNHTLKPNTTTQKSNVQQQKNVLIKTKDAAKTQTKANAVKSFNPVATKTTRTTIVNKNSQNSNKPKLIAGVVKANNKIAGTSVDNRRMRMNSKVSVSSTVKNQRTAQVNGNKNKPSTRTQLGGENFIAQDADNADICMNWGVAHSEGFSDHDFGKENHLSQSNIKFEANEIYRKLILSDRPLSPSIMKLENGVKVSFLGKTSFSTGNPFKDAMKAIENLRPSECKISGVVRRESALQMLQKVSVSSTVKNQRTAQVNGNKNKPSTRTQLGGEKFIAQDADNADISMNWGVAHSEVFSDHDFGKENHPSQSNIKFEANEFYRKLILSDRPLSPSIMKLENGKKVSFLGKTSFSTGNPFEDAMKAIENLRPSECKISGVVRRESALQMLQKERDSQFRPPLPFNDESSKEPLKPVSAVEKRPKTVKKVTFKFSPNDENGKSPKHFNQKNILCQDVSQHNLLNKVSKLSLKIGENSSSNKMFSCKLDGSSNFLRDDRPTPAFPRNVSNQLTFGNPRTLSNQNHGFQLSSIKSNLNRCQENVCKTFSNQFNIPNSEFAKNDDYKKMVLSGKTLSPMGGKFSWGGEKAVPFDRRSSTAFEEAMFAIRRSTTTGAYIRSTNLMTSMKSAVSNGEAFGRLANFPTRFAGTSLKNAAISQNQKFDQNNALGVCNSSASARETQLSNDPINNTNEDDNTPVLAKMSAMPADQEENSTPFFKLKISETNLCGNTKSDFSPFSQNSFANISKPANARTYSKKLCTPRPISFSAKSKIADSYTPEYLDRRASNLLPFAPINTPLVLKGLAKSPDDSYDGVAQKLDFENSPKVEAVVVNLQNQFSRDNDWDSISTKEVRKPVAKEVTEAKEIVLKVQLKHIPTRDKMLEFLADEECHKLLCNAAFPSHTRRLPINPVHYTLMTGNETHFVPITP